MACGGLLIIGLAWGHFYLLSGAFSGFLLVAPILATGLYEMSRRLKHGDTPRPAHLIAAWRQSRVELMSFGMLLAVIGTFWVFLSALLIALFVHVPISGFESFVRHAILARDSFLFVAWLPLGGFFAAIVFAASAVSIPLMLDRDVGMLAAIVASLEVVATNPLAMALWAAIIMLLTVIGMATFLLGLVLVVPVLGHATWHAYLDLVDATGLRERS